MADTATLKSTSSYATLLRAVDDAATPLPLKLLRMSHTGRVIEDGLNVGVHGLISSVVGMPRDIYEFATERIKGKKSGTPEKDRIMSSAWLEKKFDAGYTKSEEMMGRKRPELRAGTADELVHVGAQFVPMVGSFFIPGVGETQLASAGAKYGKAAEMVGKLAGKAGFQLNAADMTTLAISGAEKVAGVERPTEVPSPSSSMALIRSNIDATTSFSDAATASAKGNTQPIGLQASASNKPTAKLDM